MGEFDFGQFKDIFEYLQDKLNSGEALTPEEQTAYDGLISIANQGLNLTETGDFKSLYTAFNTLADKETKEKFEELYGAGLVEDPATGTVSFTRPGTLVAAMMRRGLSVRDGPIQALLSEGLRKFIDTTAKNSFAAMTNAYQAATPIRQQNVEALTRAGAIGSTAIGRLGGAAGVAGGGARRPAEGPGEGEGEGPMELPLPKAPEQPGLMDKILPGLLSALAAGGLGVLGGYLRQPSSNDPKSKILGEGYAENERPPGGGGDFPNLANDPTYFDRQAAAAAAPYNPYEVSQATFQPDMPYNPYEVSQASFQPTNNPYEVSQEAFQGPSTEEYYNAFGGNQSGTSFAPPTYADYQDYAYQPPPQESYSAYQPPPTQYYDDYSYQDYSDYGQNYNYDYGQNYQDSWGTDYDYSYSGGGDDYSYYPSNDYYGENY